MKRLLAALAAACVLALVLVLVLTGTSHKSTPAPPLPAHAALHISGLPACSSSDFFMQCAAGATGQQPQLFGLVPGSFGVDTYGAGNPGIAASFDCSYLSGFPGGKDWTASALRAWHARGKTTCVVWETAAARAEDGYSAGRADAGAALREANDIGVPSYAPIRFAVDTEAAASSVRSYFEGVHSILGSRTGVYGSYYVVQGLEGYGLVTPRTMWETIAWSFGHLGSACLFQRSINNWLSGESVDFDTARCADWGQFPYKQVPSIVCFGKHASGSKTCQAVHADVRKWQKAVVASGRVYRARGCPKLVTVRSVLAQRQRYFRTRLTVQPRVRRTHRQTALSATSRALTNVRRAISGRSCNVFSARAAYFARQIKAVEKKYA